MLYFGGQPWAGERMPVQRLTLPPPPPDNQWAKAFVDGGRGIHAETVQSALAVMLTLVIGGLISVISIVLSTVNLQFQDQFVSISLRPVLGTVAAHIIGVVWSSCSSPTWCFGIYKTSHRIWLRILSIALEKKLKVLDYACCCCCCC